MWKGQFLWLDRRCVLDPHTAQFPFPLAFILPRLLPFPFPFWFTPSSHTIFSTSLSPLPPKYVSWPCSFDHLMRSIPSLTRFFFSSFYVSSWEWCWPTLILSFSVRYALATVGLTETADARDVVGRSYRQGTRSRRGAG